MMYNCMNIKVTRNIRLDIPKMYKYKCMNIKVTNIFYCIIVVYTSEVKK